MKTTSKTVDLALPRIRPDLLLRAARMLALIGAHVCRVAGAVGFGVRVGASGNLSAMGDLANPRIKAAAAVRNRLPRERRA